MAGRIQGRIEVVEDDLVGMGDARAEDSDVAAELVGVVCKDRARVCPEARMSFLVVDD